MGHVEDEGYEKTIQYDVEMWGEVLVAWATINSHKNAKMQGEGAGKGREECNWGAEGV